ncbi:hypothetical protein OAB00_00180 [Akkermansiaceae bacterium]|nr:hypothetical protein [Akkermansiaceae bacterium]
MSQIYYHRYTMKSLNRLNVKSSKTEHEGVLLRIGEGVGCVHPWGVFGDVSVDQQLADFVNGDSSRLIRRAMHCAEIDGAAREKGISVFDTINGKVPRSHATVVGAIEEVQKAVEAGFTTVKLKAGGDYKQDAAFINEIAENFSTLKLRVDFNCNLRGSEVGDLVEILSQKARDAIDFLEDPCSYKDSCWTGLRNLYGISLAMDIGVENTDALYSFAVIKPAKNDVDKVMEQSRQHARKVVFTSYMDHPIGQVYAAFEAARCNEEYSGIVSEAGLMTHGLFEKNAFIEELGAVQTEWNYRQGTGLGFDTLLESLPWKKLN